LAEVNRSQGSVLVTGATGGVGTVSVDLLAGSADLPTTVHPFILRGVTLTGIDSVQLDIEARRAVWQQLESELFPLHLDRVTGRTRVVVRDGF
jgi:NADPH:quinone reductase-like Zn-dependent oxidoreductase